MKFKDYLEFQLDKIILSENYFKVPNLLEPNDINILSSIKYRKYMQSVQSKNILDIKEINNIINELKKCNISNSKDILSHINFLTQYCKSLSILNQDIQKNIIDYKNLQKQTKKD